ncbi:GNAT family N-acetyltransferase [Lipingzhangella sp. LS1_29]|uniref:GNAT family N-acetyltransferase n=1 Tax=Lipingzhangella rawalii TaxID=2055835 RepID=A0ABU2HD56_9ACTN|nr:GNAT family N-acetyltransferase [Lipingzhangella rawalii]MDS1272494.1 GNAT family N-acetyltransferase [Lipingzhangella rawalii]
MLGVSPVRVVRPGDYPEVQRLLDRDPVGNVFVSSRVRAAGVDPQRLQAELWAVDDGGALSALCYSGANLVPVNAGPEAVRVFAAHARSRGRRCSSIVGPVDTVTELWRRLAPAWGPAREVRPRQPVLELDAPAPAVEPDPMVRRVRAEEFDVLYPACVAMFTEEVGVRPDVGGTAALYRARIEELIRSGRSLARIEDGQVVFKAEIGAVTPHACQIQGVWVHPEFRGRNHAAPGMAQVVRIALAEYAPRVTLYVNDFNSRARAVYRHVGFREVGSVMTVLF